MTGPTSASYTYRSTSGIVLLAVCAAVSVYLLGDAVVHGGWLRMLLYAPWVLLVLWVVYEFAVVSSVRIDADGAVVRNMLRITRFGWCRVSDIDLKWQLEFAFDDGRRLSCWGGPGRARPPRQTARSDGAIRVPTSLQSLSTIRSAWERAVDAPPGAAGAGPDAPIRRTWDAPALIALAVIAAGALAAVLATR
ncbi:hypothetical protein GCM10025768_16150 [Microbacterium pseudoresistens]|uniref:PH domain-containing protein n=1 Tax=Microbacterium pseudoresistens TaxID=640634 RepID=A0A7Y9JLY7_9MICO|nr:PH domain-containing protein [Microbacterium pseudoresistens]NYD53033.1 hypothetical protein [Microbacterium pseudoresistens]